MLLLAFLAATASAEVPARPRLEIAEQAKASVRIVSGARITAEEIPQEAMVREAETDGADASQRTAWLVEFP